MELKGSKTEKNLQEAFAGESQARNKYTYFASQAKKEGYEQIAAIFLETAENEKEHAKMWFKYLHDGGVPSTVENLKAAAEGENFEHTEMYKRMAQEAREEGFLEIAAKFELVGKIEAEHEQRYLIVDVEKGVRFGLEEHLVAPGAGGDGVADQRVVGPVRVGLVGLVLVAQEDILVQVFGQVLLGDRFGDVLPGHIDAFDAALPVEFPIEPAHAGIGDLLGLHRLEGELLDALHEGRQEHEFPPVTALHGAERQGDDLRAEGDVVPLVGPAFLQGQETDHGGFLALGLAGRHEEEIVVVRFLEGLVFGHRAEFEGGDRPQVYHFLAQGAVEDIVSAHHHLGDLVGEVGEQVLPRGHPALGEHGHAPEEQHGKGNQSLHNHAIFPYKDSATARYFKITCYLCKL